ncbi:MAG: hypothetical protein M1834_006204 [Cirrosporium novae-zelandiae]|nr:MAG: hypothetical protein M1834_006204 [Cirrosporium novae-zelandiae]
MSNVPVEFSTSTLIFPLASQNFSHTLSSIRRSTLSISNRLTSCKRDSIFVQSVAEHLNLPLVANERCGSWYIPLDKKAGSTYFKSTDGHTGQWKFSLRRLNLQVLDIIGQNGGCIIVDSTRRGKSMPDALSKTVPMWCAVINRCLFPASTECHALSTPPEAVGESEHAQMEAKLDSFVTDFKELDIDVPVLRMKLKKPLKVDWVYPNSPSFPDTTLSENYNYAILCTASHRVHGAEASENGYIQGAGDDSEGWSHGLTPPLFWANQELLFKTEEANLPGLIEKLKQEDQQNNKSTTATLIKPTPNIFLGTLDTLTGTTQFDIIIACSESPLPVSSQENFLELRCASGKLGSKDLRKGLAQVRDFIVSTSAKLGKSTPKILITCPTGKDLSVGVTLMVLSLFFSNEGIFSPTPLEGNGITKAFIRQRLAWITLSNPDSNPSRSTLQAINSVLMQRP